MNSQIKTSEATLSERIEHLILRFESDEMGDGYCFHLNYAGNDYNQEEFARVLFQTLPLFTLTPAEYATYKESSPSELPRIAYDRITKNANASDYGEAILFLILDYFFDVPKFVTKVRLRTAEKVPTFGFDCAHVSFVDDEICLWLGEAKLRKTFSKAVDAAFESVESFLKLATMQAQVRLLFPHIEANQKLDPAIYDKLRKITSEIIPVGSFKIRIPILLATNSDVACDAKSKQELVAGLEAECKKRLAALANKNWSYLDNVTLDFILFPLKDKDDLVKALLGYKA